MKLLTWLIAGAAAAVAARKLLGSKEEKEDETVVIHPETPQTDDAQGEQAEVLTSNRAMDPLSCQGCSVVTFLLTDGTKRKVRIPGENGQHLCPGDKGLLEMKGDEFIAFEKESGEMISVLYRVLPSPDDSGEE